MEDAAQNSSFCFECRGVSRLSVVQYQNEKHLEIDIEKIALDSESHFQKLFDFLDFDFEFFEFT